MKNAYLKGIILILIAAVLSAAGQMHWKLGTIATDSGKSLFDFAVLFPILTGFLLYGVGSLVMIYAFRFGEVSVLHPIMSFSYVLSQIIGYFVFFEDFSLLKIVGVITITLGITVTAASSGRKNNAKVGVGNGN